MQAAQIDRMRHVFEQLAVRRKRTGSEVSNPTVPYKIPQRMFSVYAVLEKGDLLFEKWCLEGANKLFGAVEVIRGNIRQIVDESTLAVGIYGSFAMGLVVPSTSDVDVVVHIAREETTEQPLDYYREIVISVLAFADGLARL